MKKLCTDFKTFYTKINLLFNSTSHKAWLFTLNDESWMRRPWSYYTRSGLFIIRATQDRIAFLWIFKCLEYNRCSLSWTLWIYYHNRIYQVSRKLHSINSTIYFLTYKIAKHSFISCAPEICLKTIAFFFLKGKEEPGSLPELVKILQAWFCHADN